MKCPKCGKELEIQTKKVGTSEDGQPIMNEYAICRDCKKKWNLDKKRMQKPSPKENNSTIESGNPDNQDDISVASVETNRLETADQNEAVANNTDSVTSETQRYSNIPAEEVRVKREHVMKRSYDEMLATDPKRASSTHRKKKKRPVDAANESTPVKKKKAIPSTPVTNDGKPPIKGREKKARFKILRVLLGIVAILAAGYFAVMCGLDSISSGTTSSTGFVGLILALCLLVTGLLSICMKNVKNVIAFLLPVIFCLGCAAFTFIKHGSDATLLQGAIASAVLGAIYFILMIISSALANRD